MIPVDDDGILDAAGQAQMLQNGRDLISLHASHMLGPPRQAPNWQIFTLACLTRASYSLQTILANQTREVDCMTLCRSVYEHIVTMAWVAIDGPAHYPMHLRWERHERMKLMRGLRDFNSPALQPDAENLIKRATMDAAHKSAPETFDRARACDKYWPRTGAPETSWVWHFERSYNNLFRYCSAFVHPTAMGVDFFIHRYPKAVQIGLPRAVGRADVAISAIQSFADGLAVASIRFGWPTMMQLVHTYSAGFAAP